MTAMPSIRLRVLPSLAPINGKNVELQSTATELQWRNVGDAVWQELVPLSEITGPVGPQGPKGDDGGGVPNGGLAGQVLAKLTNSDQSVTWTSAGAGDIVSVNNANDFNSKPDVRANLSIRVQVADKTALKALNTSKDVVANVHDTGSFSVKNYADFAALTDADTSEGIFVRSTFDATKVWVRANVKEIDVGWFGASTTLVDNKAAFQAAINMASLLVMDVAIPTGHFEFTQGIFLPSVNNAVPGLHGAGSDKTTLDFADGVGAGINIVGIGGTVAYRFRMSRMTIEGHSTTDNGVVARLLPWAAFEDLQIKGFNVGFAGLDLLSSLFESCQFRFNATGVRLEKATLSDPNAVSFLDCNFGLNTYRGAELLGATTASFTGGAFEGNGVYGIIGNRGGLALLNCGGAGAAGVSLDSVYFEFNASIADIYIENTTLVCTYNIQGCCFSRYDEASPARQNWSTNCINVVGGSPKQILNLVGNGFSSVGTYTPNAGRKYVTWSGNVRVADNGGNLYQSSLERPIFTGNVFSPEAMTNAWVFANSDGSIARGWNVTSVTKLGVGEYRINLTPTLDNVTYHANAVVYNNNGYAAVVAPMTATTFKVNTYNDAGAPTDNAFFAEIKGGFN